MLGAIRSMTKDWENGQAISPLDAFLTVSYDLPEHLEEKITAPIS